ncbi:hypothetical protein CFE53_00600 [Methanofervidicoccus sp. A16]|uniref:hypothetical protein n=1 Tax=Methanofervidicoccus sp. A16 TaxID=2607662 RepID=UPI00118823AD|nr:hypothetical protein [Methanofervidicoccus sp. A16]AXI24746.1 hypothetical protein CFE53_00600 [Methanofervidicoccus sp. A16]MBW9219866.1 hypothetical protein [Methanothermococcus sp. SCGC AD-155-N22]
MTSYNMLAIVIATVSLLLNVILFIKVIQLKKELDHVKQSTRLTREELEKINERLRRLKTLQ